MNGRLSKIVMTSRLLKMKRDIDTKALYHDMNAKERWAAQQALNSALDILDEYHYQEGMLQKILLYVTPSIATVATVAVVSFNAMKKKKVNPEMTDEEYQIQWGNGAPDQYRDKQ